MKRIFISSVQHEFAKERKLLKRYIAKNPAYRRLFDTFVFEEDVVSADRRTDEVYLDELAKCQIYIGLIGYQYGFQDAHRDYSSSGSVQVELFADRLVIRNPGAINPAITKEELFEEHSSFPNNSLIADQLYQTKHIEKFGTGFTDLVNDCRAAGLRDPVVDDSKSDFTVTIYRPLIAKAKEGQIRANKPQITNAKDADIIATIQKYPNLSISGLANKLQITGQKMRYRMEMLRHLGILRREGAKRNGRWVITSNFQGCSADGNLLIREEMPVDPELEMKLQKAADERGVSVSIAISQIVKEKLSQKRGGKK